MSGPQISESPLAGGQIAEENKGTPIIAANPNEKQFATMQAKFALGGHALNRSTRAEDGRITFTVSRWGQSRSFTHWNDVLAFATQIGLVQ